MVLQRPQVLHEVAVILHNKHCPRSGHDEQAGALAVAAEARHPVLQGLKRSGCGEKSGNPQLVQLTVVGTMLTADDRGEVSRIGASLYLSKPFAFVTFSLDAS